MENQIMTDEHRKKIKEFQSLYYMMNARPDTTIKIYDKKTIIKMGDISTLDSMISEKLLLHNQEGQVGKSYVIVATNRHKVYNFDNIKLFEDHNWNKSESIENITLVWDFFIYVNGYENPQRHKLTVKISSGLKPEEVLNLIFSGKIEDMQDVETLKATVIAQMDFIETRLGQEFLNIVDEWVGLLDDTSYNNRFMNWLAKRRKLVAYYFNYFLFFVSIITFLIGFNLQTSLFKVGKISELSIKQLNYCVNFIVISVIICGIIINRGEVIANKIFRKLTEYGEYFAFEITTEDQKRLKRIKTLEKRNFIFVLVHLLFSLFLNVICGIIASVMYSRI